MGIKNPKTGATEVSSGSVEGAGIVASKLGQAKHWPDLSHSATAAGPFCGGSLSYGTSLERIAAESLTPVPSGFVHCDI
jgi:hypothetical protein